MKSINLLRLPFIGPWLRWRWGRLSFQLILGAILLLIIYDGLTGSQLAPSNNATVLSWVHYRGIVILLLLLAGNFFCMACPFTLPRSLAKRLSWRGHRWPAKLRNKWLAIGSIFVLFWAYEWLDLWASPWLTAWVAISYLLASFLLEAFFTESAFCKYLCPLGTFNFVYSLNSPSQIKALDPQVCRSCEGKECINGGNRILGCGTELFVPTIQSNMDCTFCLDCARACPYDNVAVATRSPFQELTSLSQPIRWDRSLMITSLAFMGLTNAFGMVPPVYALQAQLEMWGIQSDALRLLMIFGLGNLLLPALVLLSLSWFSGKASKSSNIREIGSQYAVTLVPLGLGIWLAHYGFHLAIGGATIIPVFHAFLLEHGLSFLGTQPNWSLSYLIPQAWIFPLQIFALLGGLSSSLFVAGRIALNRHEKPAQAFRELLPWALLIVLMMIAALSIFNLPMEMRGTRMIGI